MPDAIGLADRIANRLARALPRRLVTIAPERPIVSFSFDDAPASALANGARILEAHGARGTFYVAGGLAGRVHEGRTMLDAAECRALVARGHELAHHTFSHRKPVSLGFGYGRDLARNDAWLGDIQPARRHNFAFPYGLTSPMAQRAADRRFRSARGVLPGINRGAVDLGHLLTVELKPGLDPDERLGWIDATASPPGWLIYFTHDVQDAPSPWGCPPALLERLVAQARAAGAEVLTVDAALDRLGIAP